MAAWRAENWNCLKGREQHVGGVSWGARIGVTQQNTGLAVRRPRSWLYWFLHVSFGQVIQLSPAPVSNKNCNSNSDAFTVIEMLEGSV